MEKSTKYNMPVQYHKKCFFYGMFFCTVHLTVCSYHVTYSFQNESTLCSCLNVKELLARNRRSSEVKVTGTGLEPTTT